MYPTHSFYFGPFCNSQNSFNSSARPKPETVERRTFKSHRATINTPNLRLVTEVFVSLEDLKALVGLPVAVAEPEAEQSRSNDDKRVDGKSEVDASGVSE
jgi:hypothetical protein